MSETIHLILARQVEKLRKAANVYKKAQKIPHHEALNLQARKFSFTNWEHLQKHAEITALSEEPFRNGLVIAMDIKDAYDHPLSKPSLLVQDHLISSIIIIDYLHRRGYKRTDELNETERDRLEDLDVNYLFFRYAGHPPKTFKKAFQIAEKQFFFSPGFVWLRGDCYDSLGRVDLDSYIEGVNDDSLEF